MLCRAHYAARLGALTYREGEQEAKRSGLSTIHTVIAEGCETAPESPAANNVGCLIIGVVAEKLAAELAERGKPVVSIDIPYRGLQISCVASQNHTGGYEATRYLIQNGHRDIGFIGPVYAAQSVYDRYCGYRQAMEESGCALKSSLQLIGSPDKHKLVDMNMVETLAPMADKLNPRLAREATALFCAGDRIALAMINMLTTRGLRVPYDVSVIGFDDLPIAEMILPRLTTMHVQRRHFGKLAVEYLLRATASKRAPAIISLPCPLVVRDSVARIGGAPPRHNDEEDAPLALRQKAN